MAGGTNPKVLMSSLAATRPPRATHTAGSGPTPGPGLVTSAITVRESVSPGQRPTRFSFPDADECRSGALSIGAWEWDGREGPISQVEVYPGLVRLTAPDLNRREKAANRRADQPAVVSQSDEDGEGTGQRDKITGWSRKSRARMVATMAELDLAPLLLQDGQPAMVTLTYPGDWETVAPDGPVVKAHLVQFFKRFERAWGTAWSGIWKLEFQRRGAPHFHLLMVPPSGVARGSEYAAHQLKLVEWEAGGRAGRRPYWRSQVGDGMGFKQWLSAVWADVVGHPDPEERARHESAGTAVDYDEGSRARDPKRAAVYFGKHGSFAAKDYQHDVPELWRDSGKSVGRFWGYRGLRKAHGAAMVTGDEKLLLARTLRKYGTRTRVWNPATRGHEYRPVLRTVYRRRKAGVWVSPAGVHVATYGMRKQTVRAKRMTGPNGSGFLLVNDGPAMARTLARVLATCGPGADVPERLPVGMRGSLVERVEQMRR